MNNKIRLYMTNMHNQTFEFPMNPSEFEFKRASGNEKATVVDLGEIIRLANGSQLGSVDLNLKIPIDLTKRKPYWTSEKLNWPAQDGGDGYVTFLNDVFEGHEVVRVVLTNTKFNLLCVFDDYSYKLSDAADEYEVSLTLTEWRDYSPLIVKRNLNFQEKAVVQPSRPAPPAEIGIGSVVIVNGQLHRDSYGSGPGQTEVNAQRKVNFMATGRECPYHVTDMEGNWRGWVTSESVRAE